MIYWYDSIASEYYPRRRKHSPKLELFKLFQVITPDFKDPFLAFHLYIQWLQNNFLLTIKQVPI